MCICVYTIPLMLVIITAVFVDKHQKQHLKTTFLFDKI